MRMNPIFLFALFACVHSAFSLRAGHSTLFSKFPIDMQGNRIINTGSPMESMDVATKGYVDASSPGDCCGGINPLDSIVECPGDIYAGEELQCEIYATGFAAAVGFGTAGDASDIPVFRATLTLSSTVEKGEISYNSTLRSFIMRFWPTVPGTHALQVKYNGRNIPVASSVVVHPAEPDVSRSDVQCTYHSGCIITPVDRFGNPGAGEGSFDGFSVIATVEGTPIAAVPTYSDDKYDLAISWPSPGALEVAVKYLGANIVGSPWTGRYPVGMLEAYPATSCKQSFDDGATLNGAHWIQNTEFPTATEMYCDMENGGWMLVLSEPNPVSTYLPLSLSDITDTQGGFTQLDDSFRVAYPKWGDFTDIRWWCLSDVGTIGDEMVLGVSSTTKAGLLACCDAACMDAPSHVVLGPVTVNDPYGNQVFVGPNGLEMAFGQEGPLTQEQFYITKSVVSRSHWGAYNGASHVGECNGQYDNLNDDSGENFRVWVRV